MAGVKPGPRLAPESGRIAPAPAPDFQLDLTADESFVTLPLEATYAAAWPDVPKVWRDVREG